jgi:N-acetylglucosaminyldiphosphoundecaprenol N-acetyl-beta-D-mannosaminyltransferase
MTAPSVSILGVRLSALDLPTATAEMAGAIEARQRAYACTCPVYTLMQGNERPEVRAALNAADWVTPDGMPVVWALRALGARSAGRVYGPDLMLALSALSAERGYRQFYLGGAPGVAEALAQNLSARCPGLIVAGTFAPPFRTMSTSEQAAMVAQVNASRPHIVWVGLGSPKQDLWMAEFRPQLVAPLLVGVGAAFDFLSGHIAQAPRWMQRGGLEWLFRLASDPRRLWRRYLVYNPKFVYRVALQLAGVQRYT